MPKSTSGPLNTRLTETSPSLDDEDGDVVFDFGGVGGFAEGEDGGDVLWDQLMEAGRDLDVRAGSPCQAERVEAGLLSYLSDITPDMTPFEAGFGEMANDGEGDGAIEALDGADVDGRQLRVNEARPREPRRGGGGRGRGRR